MEEPIKVYIRLDKEKNIVEVASSIFLTDPTNWVEIDEGYGDKFAHAQSHYFEEPLINENGEYAYQYKRGKIVEAL